MHIRRLKDCCRGIARHAVRQAIHAHRTRRDQFTNLRRYSLRTVSFIVLANPSLIDDPETSRYVTRSRKGGKACQSEFNVLTCQRLWKAQDDEPGVPEWAKPQGVCEIGVQGNKNSFLDSTDFDKRIVRDRAEVLRGHGRYVMAFGSKPFRAAQSKVLVKLYAHGPLRNRYGALTRHLCPVSNASANVCDLELRIVSKDLIRRHPIGEEVQYQRDPYTVPAYAGLTTANVWIDRYTLQKLFAGHVPWLISTFTPKATSTVSRL